MTRVAASWCRSVSQLAGHGIKGTLPWTKVGILTQAEADWMSAAYHDAGQAYQDMLDSLAPHNVTLGIMQTLPATNRKISASLRRTSEMVDSTIRGRFAALSRGMSRRDLQKEQRRPIVDRVNSAGTEVKFEAFNPLFLRGRRFVLTEDQLKGLEKQDPEVKAEVADHYRRFCIAERDQQLQDLAMSWFENASNEAS
jgi:hypothetical protein